MQRNALTTAAFTAMKLPFTGSPPISPPITPLAKAAPCRVSPRPQRKPGSVERWVVFEQGLVAHLMREDDLFAAESTRCGRAAFDADLQPLPHFNQRPPDYFFCLRCLPPKRVPFKVSI